VTEGRRQSAKFFLGLAKRTGSQTLLSTSQEAGRASTNAESDSRDKSIGHMNYRSGDRNIFQEGLGYQSFPNRHRAQMSIRFSVQGDEFQEHEQLISSGVANIHKCQRSILRRMKYELQHNTAIY
jgi:hypothetical protein